MCVYESNGISRVPLMASRSAVTISFVVRKCVRGRPTMSITRRVCERSLLQCFFPSACLHENVWCKGRCSGASGALVVDERDGGSGDVLDAPENEVDLGMTSRR